MGMISAALGETHVNDLGGLAEHGTPWADWRGLVAMRWNESDADFAL
jgi:hypothetical protein